MNDVVSRAEAEAILGSVDEQTITELIATGATAAEVAEARAWITSDEAMLNEGRHMPTGRVAALVDILVAEDELDDGPAPPAPP